MVLRQFKEEQLLLSREMWGSVQQSAQHSQYRWGLKANPHIVILHTVNKCQSVTSDRDNYSE